jgi:hypothetical protein
MPDSGHDFKVKVVKTLKLSPRRSEPLSENSRFQDSGGVRRLSSCAAASTVLTARVKSSDR